MQIVLLSGGSGKRLWPLSNEIRSKQFIKILSAKDGYESMLQRVLRQIHKISDKISITVSTSKTQEKVLRKYIDSADSISVEPCRRNTFPAIILTAAYLRDEKKISEDESVVICPVDPYVDDNFFMAFKDMAALTEKSSIVLLGISPTYPSEKYGYIIPSSKESVSDVLEFKEKPDAQVAQKYIDVGGLWNGGVFACKISYLLKKSRELLGTDSYSDLIKKYSELPNTSFDYAVVEDEKNIKVVRYIGEWKDIGTWNTLTEIMETDGIGKVYFDKTCIKSNVINETDVPIIAMGLKNIVVAASADGILVADKAQSSYLKPLAENVHEPIRFAEKSWGSFTIIDVGKDCLTIKVTLHAGHSMNYHSHQFRREIWTIVEGTGRVIIDGETKSVAVGDVINIPVGVKHKLIADTDLKAIEIQLGEYISVDDKILEE